MAICVYQGEYNKWTMEWNSNPPCPGPVVISQDEWQQYQSLVDAAMNGAGSGGGGTSEPFDYVYAGEIFAFFFSSVVLLWWIAKSTGTVIAAVRRF